ncbi:MAG TPA: low molecular weight protein-tyrosine-phosphatase [Phycisphaerales bacterium]|nr:low molecular weight protein-tyrosine-phosphatase [Phycisphaerales bacterium]
MPTPILFVCLGNICRSPLAEGIFKHLAAQRTLAESFLVESAGTGDWHVGSLPDPRARETALRRGLTLTSRAQLVHPARHFSRGGLILAMDRSNLSRLATLGAPSDRLHLLRSFDPALANAAPHELEVPDPYFGPAEGFDTVFDMIHAACEGLLDHLLKEPRA